LTQNMSPVETSSNNSSSSLFQCSRTEE
jgi:hypothetical protein